MSSRLLAICVALTVAGCGSLPASGPSASAIVDESPEGGVAAPYVVAKIDPEVVNITGQYRPPSFASFFKVPDTLPAIRLASGDRLGINIFEAGADGLFSTQTVKATQIETVIGADGQIFVPYVGMVQASGRTVEALRASIEAALEDQAIQPQVQVLVAESLANSATVLGSVNTPGQVPIAISGIRLLDVIAAAGGATSPTYETRVILRRGNEVASADLEQLFDHPDEDVPVRPGDTILISDVARTYTVFGAVGQKAEVEFESRRVTLAEALARAGGLDDSLADPQGVFLFRFEPAEIAKAVNERAVTAPDGTRVPVIYRLNMKDPNAFFLASTFDLRDEDILYVSNAPSIGLAKFLDVLAPVVSTTTTVATLTNRLGNN